MTPRSPDSDPFDLSGFGEGDTGKKTPSSQADSNPTPEGSPGRARPVRPPRDGEGTKRFARKPEWEKKPGSPDRFPSRGPRNGGEGEFRRREARPEGRVDRTQGRPQGRTQGRYPDRNAPPPSSGRADPRRFQEPARDSRQPTGRFAPRHEAPRHIKPEGEKLIARVTAQSASPIVRAYRPLLTEKGRLKESQFLLEGVRSIRDVVAISPSIVNMLLLADDFQDPELMDLARKSRIQTTTVSRAEIEELSQTETPQGVIAVANFAAVKLDWSLVRHVTLLDGVQDPGNVGAIFRTSVALGMDALVLGKGTCEAYNPKVVRSTVGALMRIPFESGVDLPSKLAFLRLKGFSIVATSSHAHGTLDTVKLRKKVALIVGNEGAGTDQRIMDLADTVVRIPLKNQVESLNVGVAHGILSYQLLHNRE